MYITKMILLKFIAISLSLISLTTLAETNSWQKLASEDNINIFSKKALNGVLPFKAEGKIDANIEVLLNILKDHKNKNQWAPKLDTVKMHEQKGKNKFIFSEYYKTPWPASDREFLLSGTIERPTKSSVILRAHSIDQEKGFTHFKSHNHVQADVQYINVILKKISANQTSIKFEFHGDMKGWMPLWLMNLIQKKWPLRFIQGLRKYSAEQRRAISFNQRD
ncbi:MAG: hypothetical protein ACJAS4_002049 [Bacteriovoracaceae bacterium]|jgi:hypothetical protein